MPAEPGRQADEQRRLVGLGLELLLERLSGGERVAQQCEIARATAAGGQAGKRAGEIGHGLET